MGEDIRIWKDAIGGLNIVGNNKGVLMHSAIHRRQCSPGVSERARSKTCVTLHFLPNTLYLTILKCHQC